MYLVTCPNCYTTFESKSKKKFCNQSCAASFNNRGVRRHGLAPTKCVICGSTTGDSKRKYCSISCLSKSKIKYHSEDELKDAVRKQTREYSAAYRAKLRKQTPPDADRKAIKAFYDACPIGYEVDHIVPISKGGLHTLHNLQYLTITDNRKKGAKLWWSDSDSNGDIRSYEDRSFTDYDTRPNCN